MDYFVRKDTGSRLAYDIKKSRHADAETLLLIHGLSFNSHIWDTGMERLLDEYHIVTYDLGGHGDSETLGKPLTWELLSRGLIYLLDHLGIESCHVVGHGFGGIVGLKTALAFKTRVRTLSLISTPLYFPEDMFKYEYESRIHLLENDFDGFVDKLVRAEVNVPDGKNRPFIEDGIRQVNPHTYRDGVELVFDDAYSLMKDLPLLEVPTLLMSGDRNPVYPPHYMALYATIIPTSRLQIIPNASNAVFIDHPGLFADALKDFLRSYTDIGQTPGYHFLLSKMRSVLANAYKAEAALPVLDIRVLKKFSVWWKGVPLEGKWTQRSAKELLLYLSMRKSVSRDSLIDAFFSEADAYRSKNYLRVMLNHLKTIFEATGDAELIGSFEVTRDVVSLRCNINSDLTQFLGTLKKGFDEKRNLFDMRLEFLHLLDLYESGFLVGFHAKWVGDLRVQIENKLSDALSKLVSWHEARGLYHDALQLLRAGRSVEVYDGYCDEKMEEILAERER